MTLGVCGPDREIAEGAHGTPPSGEARLIIGNESLGEVLEAPSWTEALDRHPEDIKVVVDLTA